MTNEEVVARMWEAYKAGILHNTGVIVEKSFDQTRFKREFDKWLVNPENFPELTKLEPYDDRLLTQTIKSHSQTAVESLASISKKLRSTECADCGFALHNCVCSHGDYEND